MQKCGDKGLFLRLGAIAPEKTLDTNHSILRMAILGSAVENLFFLTLIAIPVVCALKGYGFWRTNLIAIPLIALLITLWAWFIPFYDDLQLRLMLVGVQ